MTIDWIEIGPCRIANADCLAVLPTLEAGSVDAVVTDPPYDAKTHAGAWYGFRATSSEIPFAPADITAIVPAMLGVSSGWVVAFCSLEMFGAYRDCAGDAWVRAGFWRRTNGVPQFSGDRPGQPGEGIAIMHAGRRRKAWNRHGNHAFWEYPIVCNGPHPTTKPVPLMENLVTDFTTRGELVADCFMGSGTTGVACIRTGRKFIGIEISEEYFEIARRRLQAEYDAKQGTVGMFNQNLLDANPLTRQT
jgi:site-specific DNA-methyltransferase (adenine-specific)